MSYENEQPSYYNGVGLENWKPIKKNGYEEWLIKPKMVGEENYSKYPYYPHANMKPLSN